LSKKSPSERQLGGDPFFWNLLKNAIKFTPSGGCVGVRCRPNTTHVDVEVNDSGIGISSEALPRVFDAFEQAERSVTR